MRKLIEYDHLSIDGSMSGDVADKIDSLPKYAAASTLTETKWNAEVLVGDPIEAVAELEAAGDGTLVEQGNGTVVLAYTWPTR